MARPNFDIAVVGGGIVGLATGLCVLRRRPGLRLVVLEKEDGLARHQTGHNSGVLHTGIYYAPGSAKAAMCVDGYRHLIRFCEEEGVEYSRNGKVIVATTEEELPVLHELAWRGAENGVEGVRLIGPGELAEIEPHARGLAALHVASAGAVDFTAVAAAMAKRLRGMGAEIRTTARVESIHHGAGELLLETTAGAVSTGFLVNCAGLYADRVARLAGADPPVTIVPFRGEYQRLRAERDHLVRSMVYPVPDPRFPFLGAHFTRRVDGVVEVGPNAVLALAREGYRWSHIKPSELWRTLVTPGFAKLARTYWRTGFAEAYRSLSKRAATAFLQRLVPEVVRDDLLPGGSGVRAQAVAPTGKLVDDFAFADSPRAVHVLNAPSPAATASLAIGDHVAARVLDQADFD